MTLKKCTMGPQKECSNHIITTIDHHLNRKNVGIEHDVLAM